MAMKKKFKLVTCNGCELMEDDYHEHCPECDCVLTWLEGDICRWCEERIEGEAVGNNGESS